MTRTKYQVVVRSSWGAEFDVGSISVDQSEPASTVKSTLASMLFAIASELSANAYEGPREPQPWLDNVALDEFTDSIPRDRSMTTPPGWCGALPARAFRGRYASGCQADEGHTGSHYTDRLMAERAMRRAAILADCTPVPPTSSILNY